MVLMTTEETPNSKKMITLRILYFLLGLACGMVLTFLFLIIVAAVYGLG